MANYLIQPTKHAFPKLVIFYSLVISFVTKLKKNKQILSSLLREGKLSFQVFTAHPFQGLKPDTWLFGDKPYTSLSSIAMRVNTGKEKMGQALRDVFRPSPG